MRFELLGSLRVVDGGCDLTPARPKQRALLALLLLRRGEVVAGAQLIEALWGEDPPGSAQNALHGHVSALRKLLGAERIRTRPPGYLLSAAADEVDVARFESLVERARAREDPGDRSAGLRDALALWRGEPLADLQGEPLAEREIARLEELRLAALEDRIDADLAAGRHFELVAELETLVAEHVFRERLRGQLMLALYRCGRQADALHAFQTGRRALVEQLGLEPGPALQQLELQILRHDASLELAATPATAPPLGEPEEMLKLVTVLFADIGSTAWAQKRHPEDLRALISDYLATMAREIQSEGGTIEKLVGGAMMAVFGVPAVHEDDAVRAVRAARRMLERLRSFNEALDPAEALAIRIGLSTGDVLASGVAGGDVDVTGGAVNVAARLQQIAEPGTIVVADRTARAVGSHFELRPIGEPLALNGDSEALVAWLVEGDAEERLVAPTVTTPLVGRAHELAFLRTTFDGVCLEGRPALVTVVGDAGVGKSRLVREFLSPLEGEAKMLVGRCLASGHGVTLWPLGEMLKTEAGVLETDPSDEAAAKIATLVEISIEPELAREPSRSAAALASTLGLRPPGDPLASLDPRELYRELVDAWRALLVSMAMRAPVVAVVEDLHWADATMLDVLDELAERLDGRLLFLCTARPELLHSRPDWGGGRRSFSSLPLDPLSSAESARLVSFLPGVDALPDGVRRLILERASGNPFFAEEIVRHLINDGRLVWEGERWRAREGIDQVEIPDNVQAVILARLDLLAPQERRAAQRAAVVGQVFWDGALACLAPRTRRCGRFAAESSCSSGCRRRSPANGNTCSSTCSSATSRTRACRGRSEAAPTRRPPPGSRRRAASGRASWQSCSRTTTTPRSRSCARTSSGGAPAGISSSPRPTRTAGSPSSKASGSRCEPSSSPRAGKSGWRRSRRSATSTTSRSSAMPRGARTSRHSRSSPIATPRSRESPGKPRCSAVVDSAAPCMSPRRSAR